MESVIRIAHVPVDLLCYFYLLVITFYVDGMPMVKVWR